MQRGNCVRLHHKSLNRPNSACYVLNVPLSSVIWPLKARTGPGDYIRAMMIKYFLTICAAATVAAAGTSLAQAQSYPVQQAPSYGAPAEYRPGDRARISTRWKMTTTRCRRPRCRRPVRLTIRATAAARRSSGLFGRPAARPGDVAG